MAKRILSGVQPSGKLHLGNYFGAIRQQIALQDEGDCFYFIADYHALTTLKDAEARDVEAAKNSSGKFKARRAADILRQCVFDVAADYLALGLDPAKATLFRQSDVPEVTELAWILSTVTGMGLLERATSYKDKIAKGIDASVGLFTYPVLMAADILICRAAVVPVGKDQVQHLEMARDMAGYFNRAYGAKIFPMPKEMLGDAPIVPGTDGQKMSKSHGNTINLFAEGAELKAAVMGIVTDVTPLEEPKVPEGNNVFELYKLLATEAERDSLAERYRGGNFGYGEAKKILLGKIDEYFGPFRQRRQELAARPDEVEEVLRDGASKARAAAQQTMELVRSAVGLRK